jgi:hypothetical protein
MTEDRGNPTIPAQLKEIVDAGARANHEVAGSIAVCGTVCTLYAGHRLSMDIVFVVPDLTPRFDEVREHLLSLPSWHESRVRAPKLILGDLDSVPIGFRQQIRPTAIQTQEVQTALGPLVIPTLDEMLSIKAILAYDRNSMRDMIDLAELTTLSGSQRAVAAIESIDEKYAPDRSYSRVLEVAKVLAACEPTDAEFNSFKTFKLLSPRLKSWDEVQEVCRALSRELTIDLLGEQP